MALTPAEQAARTAGYPMPEGTEMIKLGDDAIRGLGVTAHSREYHRPPLTGSVHLDHLVQPGLHPIPTPAIATAVGSPLVGPGFVIVYPTGYSGANGPIVRQSVGEYTSSRREQRTRLASGEWDAWDAGIVRSDLGSAIGHITRVSEWLATSPPVHTSGLGAVAFTFDHGLTKFKTAGIPARFGAYGWGFGLALNDSTLASAENNGASDADVLAWSGAEIWNHGFNHASTRNPTTVRSVVVQGKTALEARYGREVFGYIPAGRGPDGLAGFDGGSSPEMFATSLAGQLILEHHAVTTGYLGSGGVRRLDGTVQQGLSRFTMDTQTVARIKQQIDLAISERCGVMFMAHPALLDTAGHLTTAQLLEVLAYARQREQAGALAVLSPGELVRADAGPAPAAVADTAARLAALEQDTGSRLLAVRPGVSGQVLVQRQADRVTLTLRGVTPEPGSFGGVVCDIPSGFRAPQDTPLLAANFTWTEPASVYVARASHNLYWVRTITDSNTRPTSPQSGTVTYRTTDSWPTTLPGTPA